jgi:death-on-curing protein
MRALESALVAAENREYYENASLATCAATYAYHLTQAHAFIDGNKRVAAAISEIFLEINGARLSMTNEQIIKLFLDIAAGVLSRDEVEQLFQQYGES